MTLFDEPVSFLAQFYEKVFNSPLSANEFKYK